jgi:hypothetical protein
MKITIKRVETKPVSVEAFADENGLEMEVNEREPHLLAGSPSLSRFYASFHRAEVKAGGILASPSGNGKTIKAAIKDYAKQIQGQILVVNAYASASKDPLLPASDMRREIQVPKKLHCQGIKVK